jgi:hypothetical protein
MAEGGFLVRFDGKEVARCYSVAFDYDEWQFKLNAADPQPLPEDVKTITVIIERGGR